MPAGTATPERPAAGPAEGSAIPLDPDELTPLPADFSVMGDNRLVAFVWLCDGGGHVRRAGARGAEAMCELAYAEVEVFDPRGLAVFTRAAARAGDLDAFFVELKLEGYDVLEGAVGPSAELRRF